VITIEIANAQSQLPVDARGLERAVRMILEDESIRQAEISVAVVDDATICRLNRQYLNHDRPTDVLSFVLDQDGERLEGEIVASAETARTAARRFGWSAAEELLLYVVHGALHLVGCEDATAAQRTRMRQRERTCLAQLGLEARYREVSPSRGKSANSSNDPSCGGKAVS